MPKYKHPNRDHMPYKHLHLLDTAYCPPISHALPRTTHCPRRRPRPRTRANEASPKTPGEASPMMTAQGGYSREHAVRLEG